MKFRTDLMFSAVCVAALMVAGNALAYAGRLSPQDFNKMYYLAQNGKVGILREAVNRGLNIDAVNPNGDTGLCIAVKRKDYVAYNTFRMSGANPRHRCTYEMYEQYQEFLEDSDAARANRVVGNEESLYYEDDERSWWPWILGGAAVGGGIWALTSGGSKSKKDKTIIADNPEYGLTGFLDKYYKLVGTGEVTNSYNLNGANPNAGNVVDRIKFLPNMLDNKDYLQAYIKIINGAAYRNLEQGSILLGDAAVGMAAYGANSRGLNDGAIKIDARNGAIGMAASNGAEVVNNPNNSNGKIDIIFKGGKEGDAVIGMYADTGSKAVNYGQINGTSSKTPVNPDSSTDSSFDNVLVGGNEATTITSANSGAVIGMGVFDFYTGTNNSAKTVSAENYGDISLSAGYNSATDVSVNLVGMGSYIDDGFLNGISNPAYAEQMKLNNYGNIALKYDGVYKVSDTALKLGDGGLIGMRADASTEALNRGMIDIVLTSTEMSADTDVAAGMLSVHGAEITNGTKGAPYNGLNGATGGTIRITNEAQSGGVSYGMLAAKGDGTQTKLYQWKAPKVYNYGLIDMLTSNSYAMASFAGGEVVNNGVINLGYDKGGSFYKNNYGIYGAGGDDTASATIVNNGIINVYATESTALYNAFAGAVTLENNGKIYISNKATNSQALGGNFSEAVNRGLIEYKVGNSENAGIGGAVGEAGFAPSVAMENAVVTVGDTVNTKQLFVNERAGEIIIGDVRQAGTDYGGTYVTAGVQVKNQGAASNDGLIRLVKYDRDTPQVNAAMWLDDTTSNEAYINNRGDIIIDATASIGMRNASQNGAEATNYGHILVNGDYAYGMSVVNATRIFNGREKNVIGDSTSLLPRTITVNGDGAAGMYIKDGVGYNYGNINVTGRNATAVIIDSTNDKKEHFYNYGDITFSGNEGQNYYWLANGSAKDFYYDDIVIDKYTLAKVTDGSEGSFAGSATIAGKNAHLFAAEDGTVSNTGDLVVKDGATAIIAGGDGGSKVTHSGTLTIGDAISEATGIDADGAGTTVELNSGVTVNNGLGVYAGHGAEVTNSNDIIVNKGVGLLIEGIGDGNAAAKGANEREITVNGPDSIGVKVLSLAELENNGNITVSGGGLGVQSDSDWENAGSFIVSGDDSVAVNVLKNQFKNSGTITLNSAGAYAIYNQGGVVTNDGEIIGVGTGVYNESGTFLNTKTINLSNGTGIVAEGGNVTNGADIQIGRGIGMLIDGANVQGTNASKITVTNGTGMEVDNGFGENSGSILVTSGYGMYVNGANAEARNSGTITIEGNGTGAYVRSGSFTNTGTIVFNSDYGGACTGGSVNQYGECVDNKKEETAALSAVVMNAGVPVYVGADAKFINSGAVDFGAAGVDFDAMRDEKGAFVVADGGSFRADAFKGEVIAGKDIVLDGFADTYVNESSFEGKNEGLTVKSESYLFEANAKDKEDVTDIELNRKKFEEVVEEKDLAAFWENNYQLQHNEKMFNALKSAETAEEFDYVKEAESGKNFYANLPRENMAVLRGLNVQEQNRILEDGLDGTRLGADYYRTGKDGQRRLSGYDTNVYSPYISYGNNLNRNWSIGGSLRVAYADSEYDEAKSSRDNKILLATLPILYRNGGFKFLTTPSAGVGFGSYKRKALSGNYEADTTDFYYGMYNHAEYSVDMKVAELVAEAELNLQGSSMGKAKEEDGLNLHSVHSLSLESGVGLKLRKRFALAKERSLMLAVGVKYYHEFLDPYKDLTVGMSGSPLSYKVNAYKEDKDRIRTTAEAVYKDGDFSVAAEIAHNAEKESNVEGGVGVRYNF